MSASSSNAIAGHNHIQRILVALLILSLGSNVNAISNIGYAIESLRQEYGDIMLSTVYESEAIGFPEKIF